jgi:6-phosphogluconolactonase/glucosamine-6-phosphate isomerase/deaminase
MKRRDFVKERAFYNALAGLIESGVAGQQVHGMIVPGGTTPKPLYQRLFQHGLKIPPDFRFILSDERYCPVNSPDSNQGSILPLLRLAGVDRKQVIVPDVSLPASKAAVRFDDDIAAFLKSGGSIETAVLGVGSDGHTAGIFNESAMQAGKYAAVTKRADGKTGITSTPELYMLARRLVFILRGATKQDTVELIMSDPQATVAGRIGSKHPEAEIWFCLE